MPSTRKPLLVFACIGSIVAVPALAQQSPYPPPCDASKVTKADVDRAHTVFLSGKQFLEESNYDKAISYFKDAYAIDCSVHGILPIIATAYERKGDKAEAVRALEEYLRRAPPNAPDREVIERRIKNLNDQLTREQPAPSATSAAPSASAAPTVSVAPLPSSQPAPPAPVGSGNVTGAAAGATEAPSGGTHGVAPWIVVGAGGAAVVTGIVLYVVGAGDVSSAANSCPFRKNCAPDIASKGNNGRTLETAGVIAGGAGLAAVAGGLLWHFVEGPQTRSDSGARVSPDLAPGYAGMTVRGAF